MNGRTVVMNMTKWICAILTASLVTVWAETDNTELLAKYRKIYDDTAAEYESVNRMATQAWPIEYIRALQALQAKLQSSGDLDGWEATNAELNRFKRDMKLGETVSSPAELRVLQESVRTRSEQLTAERDAKLNDLRSKYVSRLAELQREWTQQGKFTDAFKARDEIARVGGMPKEPTAPAAAEREPEPTERPATPSPVPTEAITQADGTMIYPPGIIAPTEQGVVFKTELMSGTEHSPWSPGVLVKIWETSDKESDSFQRDHFVGDVDGKVKSDKRYVRASLRTAKSGVQKRDLQLQIQYYAKPAGGSGDPRLVTTRYAEIPALDTRQVYVDLSLVSIDSLSRSVSIGPFRDHSKTVGDKFYGYIVSVLDSEGALQYQGASSTTLAKLATVPEPKRELGFGRGKKGFGNQFRRDDDDDGVAAAEDDTRALRAEVEAAYRALKAVEASARLKPKGTGKREEVLKAEQRLREAAEKLRRAQREDKDGKSHRSYY